jgi:PBP1b-binding outer membrane lipoprotein LpoB
MKPLKGTPRMLKPLSIRAFYVLCFAFCVFLCGCSSEAISKDRTTTFLTSDDMQAMTDKMAASITSDPAIQQAAAKGPLIIVIKPVENQTNEIIRDNRKELFVHRLQGLLTAQPALREKFAWVVNRSDYQKLQAEEIPDVGPSEDRIQPEYALWATFLADTRATAKGRSDIYLCQYKLTNLQTGLQLWTGQYETSKQIKKGMLD